MTAGDISEYGTPGASYACRTCGLLNPTWYILRHGDGVCTWACDTDLHQACDELQRDHEITKLTVTHSRKSAEWNDIRRRLSAVDPSTSPTPREDHPPCTS